MKSADLSEASFNWGYRDMAKGMLYDAGEELRPSTLRYRRTQILRKLSKKYLDALMLTPTVWVRLSDRERDAYIDENDLHSNLDKSVATSTLRYNAQTKTMYRKMTLGERHALHQQRKIEKLRRKYQKLLTQEKEVILRKDPALFNDYPWDIVYQWQIDKYV
ncbi:MAG: hypothetical protein KF713_18925 [Turneriella sp.]|nr:hypothetical protein [Turneriella sp.]